HEQQFDNNNEPVHNNTRNDLTGEVKPFGYRIRRLILKKVFKMEAQKRMKGKDPFDFDEVPEAYRQAEQVALAAYFTVEMPDNERLILIDSYCRTCKNRTIRLFSTKTRKLICTGCGKELARL
ncbi:unnamed protein product, partial [marine sediment metagenome]